MTFCRLTPPVTEDFLGLELQHEEHVWVLLSYSGKSFVKIFHLSHFVGYKRY
jgi:hypothetical protein